MSMFDLMGKAAIVTGARRGIGKGIALALAKAGADVTVSDISLEDCQKVIEEIEGLGRKGLAVKCDVTKKSEVDEMVQKTVEEFGKVDILVNNAGILGGFVPFLEMTQEDWDKVLEINLKGQFLCAQAAAKEMVKQKWGRIVNIASIASGQVGIGYPQIAHYCASKGGIIAMTEALALELSPQGINVNAIGPGVIETAMTKDMLTDEQTKKGMLARLPKGRVGQPEDIGAAAVFLSSDEADYVTGATLFVDGGWLAG